MALRTCMASSRSEFEFPKGKLRALIFFCKLQVIGQPKPKGNAVL